ncbi:MAG: VWA domain-containing protein [Alphaproteobacteria bacterium]|nr:VWA domain-containing protein [Alphaproteobacteria bacterium]
MVRIEAQPVQGGPVIVVLDVSGSMEEEGRLDAARAIASALVRRLGADREIGLVLFAGEPFTASEPGGEDDRTAVLESLAAIDRTYENTDLARAVDHALALGGAGARLVVLSDGAVNDAGRITAALGESRAALSAIAVRIAPEPYAEIADLALRADTGEDAAPLADELAAAVGGPMRIAWTAPRDARPGQVRPVSVSVPDRRVDADSEYAAPDDPVEAPASTMRLALALETPDGVRRSTRTLARLTPQTAQFSLQARHRIIANLAEPDPGHVLRRYLDLMIDLVRARDAVRAGAGFTSLPDTGPDYVALALGGQLRTLPRQALAGVELQTRHPLLALHSVTPAGSQGALVLEERLDVLDDGEWGRFWGDASRQSDAGAALAAAEAVALNQTPIATRMLAAGDAVLTRGTITSAAAAGFQIQVNSYGAVRAGLSDPPGKGMRATRVAAQFADLQDRFEMAGHVASGLGAMTGAPGGPIGAFVSLQSENLKAWCYASVTLGFLNEEIAGEATGSDDWTGYAAAQCRYSEDGLAMTYLTSMAQGFALGTLGDVLTPVVAGPVGPIASGPVVDGVVNTDLSYVITEMHGALMDRLQQD